ncbi:MAG: L-serine ammonia-lyase, iron-sulfur-dependent, subunit alpha [Lachnospiraceae bacterium]|nr:L-serine ammonia-lyase, iron-sulfur-dependent, subunit alpha [Lachnospiraceae bacterium]
MIYKSLKEICDMAAESGIPFWKVIQKDDCTERNVEESESFEQMRAMYRAMQHADHSYTGTRKSNSGMVGGDGKRVETYVAEGKAMSGPFIGKVMERAIKMGESNACMRRIVAAPTAGSCGVLPAVLLTYADQIDADEDKSVEALYTAAGIGQIIAHRASISGAFGGCQAEIGSASAMAAGALVHLKGGKKEEICCAVAIALKSLLGLTCDPIGGLVEVPCVKRNVIGAVNAVTAADMVMAGVTSVIPADEVIDVMGEIGNEMPKKYKETAEGGLATSPTGMEITKNLPH